MKQWLKDILNRIEEEEQRELANGLDPRLLSVPIRENRHFLDEISPHFIVNIRFQGGGK